MASLARGVSLKSRIAQLLGVETGEGPVLSLMVLLYFVVSIAFVLVQTTAFGLFIDEFGSQNLPYAYLSVALLASAAAFAYLKLSERVSFGTAQYVNLAFLALICLAFWVGLGSGQTHWYIFLLPFWFQALVNLANLTVWHLAGHLFNVRQAKRLFGLVGAGNWLANIVGGLVIGSILIAAGAARTYLYSAVALIAAALVLRPLLKRLSTSAAMPAGASTAARGQAAVSPFRHPYSRLIFAYTLLWWLAFVVIDNIFFDRAGLQFPRAEDLAGFLGAQLSVTGVIAIITTSFLTSRIVGKYGLRTGLLIMPLFVAAAALVLVVGGALHWSVGALFWIATAAKTLNVALGFSLSLAVGTLLYQPLLGNQRNATQTMAEGIVQPVAIGLAAVILLVFNTFLHFNAVGLSYLFLAIAALWVSVIIRISREYPRALSEALRKRSLGETTSLLLDPAALAQLETGLRALHPGAALYALNQLEQLDPVVWRRTLLKELPALLAHPAFEVRREAARRALSVQLKEAASWLRERLRVEDDHAVRAALIQAVAALGDEGSSDLVAAALQSSDLLVRRGAILGSLASADPPLIERARALLLEMVESTRAADRLLAAEILTEASFEGSARLVSRLLSDPDLEVRKGAIVAVAGQEDVRLLEQIVLACNTADTAPLAERTLISRGAASLGAITLGLKRIDPEADADQRRHSLIHALGSIQDPRALELLCAHLDTPSPEMRTRVLRSLSAQAFRARPADRVPDRLRAEIDLSAWIAGAIHTIEAAEGRPGLAALGLALDVAFREARSRVLLLLSFIYDSPAMLRAERALDESTSQRIAFAAETVDSLLPTGLKPLVIPLVENVPYGRRLSQLQAAKVDVSAPTLDNLISTLLAPDSDRRFSVWTRMVAAHAAGLLGLDSSRPALQALLSDPRPGLSQTAQWSLKRMESGGTAGGEGDMLSIVEKVLILKSVRLFSETPDNVLADIAAFADEVLVEKGQVVFHKGDRGDSLYIIVTGAVEVMDGSRLLNRLAEGDIFGELALLDPEPRLATVTAAESTHLLRLKEPDFRVILSERPEVSSAIIRVITRYLRGLLRNAGTLDPNLPAAQPLQGPTAAAGSAA